jgi:hypothetical protein
LFYAIHQEGSGWRIEDGNSLKLIAHCPTKDDADMIVKGLAVLSILQDVVRLSGAGQLKSLLDIASGSW